MVSTPDGIYPNFTYQTNKTVVIIWIVTAIIIFIWQQLKYFHLKKLVKQSMTDIVDLNILSFIDYCRHNMGIKEKSRFLFKLPRSFYNRIFFTRDRSSHWFAL